jgi:hypothetical protein
LCAANNGGLWIGSASGLIARVSGTDLQKVHVGAGIEAIVEAAGDVWVIAKNAIYRFGKVSPGELVPVERVDPVQITRVLASGASSVLLETQAAPRAIEGVGVQARKLSLGGRTLFLTKETMGRTGSTAARSCKTEGYQ